MKSLLPMMGRCRKRKRVIETLKPNLSCPIKHVWQNDHGFRASRVRNKGVLQSKGDYLIFLDGDCLPRRDFIENHVNISEQGWFVRGNRIMMTKKLTHQVLKNKQQINQWSLLAWVKQRIQGGIKRILPILHLKRFPFRKSKSTKWFGVKTCNLGIWRKDFYKVNGLDESYQGWGREDSDLAVRLINAGMKRKEGVFATAVFHFWHQEAARDSLNYNDELLQQCMREKRIYAVQGLNNCENG